MTRPPPVDYDRISLTYDEHRGWTGEVPGRLLDIATQALADSEKGAAAPTVLELGCGTGNATRWLAERWDGPVVALDRSKGMLQRARGKVSSKVCLLRGEVTRLPLGGACLGGAVGSFFLHHLDAAQRMGLFAELRRVLRPGGGVAFLTVSHAQVRGCALGRWFPTVIDVDCARFPDLPVLEGELRGAGFGAVGFEDVHRSEPRGTAAYLEKARGHFISTLELIPESDFRAGLERMERQLAADGHLGDISWSGTIVHAALERADQ